MFKSKKPYIEFISTVSGIDQIEECRPKPAKHFIPDWFKDINPKIQDSVKRCPSFTDYFSMGYIVPMWMDSTLYYDNASDRWTAIGAKDMDQWTIHTKNQFLDHANHNFLGDKGKIVFKTSSPWVIVTSPGYSVLQLPLFYHYNNDYSLLPGIIDTDISHEINQQLIFTSSENNVFIPRGAPLAMYVPIKREKFDMTVRFWNQQDSDKLALNSRKIFSKHIGSGAYRQMQRERDNK